MAARVDGANMEDFDELLSTPEYARKRKCSERTIERERTSGTGCKFVKIGRSVRYRRRDILDFIARHVRGSTSELAPSSPEDIVGARPRDAAFDVVTKTPLTSQRRSGSRLAGPPRPTGIASLTQAIGMIDAEP
jgi:predicted DNA-binding transcriptional regulator AlpA